MTNKITKKIIGYKVLNKDIEPIQEQPISMLKSIMHEGIKRDDELYGKTYKIKIASLEHAVYVTVNRMMVDDVYYPYEVFINSKNVEHLQYITAITRLISSVMRKGGNVRFIAEELMQVFDANGGHWTKKGANGEKPRFMPSLVAEIGLCLSKHFDYIDYLNNAEKQPIEPIKEDLIQTDEEEPQYPPSAQICPSCKQKSAMLLDGCLTCLDGVCAYSKCG
jgi:hypothetical protein